MSLCKQAIAAAYEILVEESVRRQTMKHDALPEPESRDHKPLDLGEEIPF